MQEIRYISHNLSDFFYFGDLNKKIIFKLFSTNLLTHTDIIWLTDKQRCGVPTKYQNQGNIEWQEYFVYHCSIAKHLVIYQKSFSDIGVAYRLTWWSVESAYRFLFLTETPPFTLHESSFLQIWVKKQEKVGTFASAGS